MLILPHFSPSRIPRNHFSAVLIGTYWYTISCIFFRGVTIVVSMAIFDGVKIPLHIMYGARDICVSILSAINGTCISLVYFVASNELVCSESAISVIYF